MKTNMSNWHCSWLLMLQHSQIWERLSGTLCLSPPSVMEQTLYVVLSQHTETCGGGTAKAMCHLHGTLKCYNSLWLLKNLLLKFQNKQGLQIQEKALLGLSRLMDLVHLHHQCQRFLLLLVKKMGVLWIRILAQASWAELEFIWLVHIHSIC